MITRRLTVTREWIKAIGLASDAIGPFTDVATKQIGKTRLASDSILVIDSASQFDPAVDLVLLSDAASDQHALHLTASDSFTIADTTQGSKDRWTISDSAKAKLGTNAHDSFAIFDGLVRRADDGFLIYDVIQGTPHDSLSVSDVAGIHMARTASDGVTISDHA